VSGDDDAFCIDSELDSWRRGHLTPLNSTGAYYAGNEGLSIVFTDFFSGSDELFCNDDV